jgi:hypothetical protein
MKAWLTLRVATPNPLTGPSTPEMSAYVGQFKNDDAALGGLTFPTFQFDLQPFDFMEVRIGNLAASPAPTGALGAPFNMVTNGVSQNYYLMYADPNPIIRGHTYAIQIQVKFGPTGYLNVWRDGEELEAVRASHTRLLRAIEAYFNAELPELGPMLDELRAAIAEATELER